MPLFLQRQETSAGDTAFQLQPPSLLHPPESRRPFGLGLDLNLTLTPETEQIIAGLLAERMDPTFVRPALESIDLRVAPALVPPTPSTGGAPNPFAVPATPEPPGLVPRGAGPATPRAAGAGDVLRAITRIPAVDEMLTRLQTLAMDRVRADWGRLSTGEQVGVVSTGVVISAGALAGVLSDPSTRQFVWSQLNGRVWPVPGVDWLRVEFRAGEGDVLLGGHVDVGRLLPPSWGFGPSSPRAFGAPPSPGPFVPGVQRKASPGLHVNDPDDASERQADEVANRVMRHEVSPVPNLDNKPRTLQRICHPSHGPVACPQAGDESAAVQLERNGARPTAKQTPVPSAAIHAPGVGRPIESPVRQRVEPVLGADLSDVRVHDQPADRQTSAQLQARAFTHGRDIWLGPGERADDPGLLAHELTHVLQQDGVVRRKPAPWAQGTTPVIETDEEEAAASQGGEFEPSTAGKSPARDVARTHTQSPPSHRAGLETRSASQPYSTPGSAFQTPAAPSPPDRLESQPALTGAAPEAKEPETAAVEPTPTDTTTEIQTSAATAESRGLAAASTEGVIRESEATEPALSSPVTEVNETATGVAPVSSSLSSAASSAEPAIPTGMHAEPEPDESAGKADTESRMAAAQPAADRAAEDAAAAELEEAETSGESIAEPAVTGTPLGGADAASASEELDGNDPTPTDIEEDTAELDEAGASVESSPPETLSAGNSNALLAGGGELEPTSAATTAESTDVQPVEPVEPPESPISEELPVAERDAGLASISDAGGGAEYSGGGGEGGSAVPDLPEAAEPSVPEGNPIAAMSAVSSLPPVRLAAALGSVAAAATVSVNVQRDELESNPPQLERPSGAARTRDPEASVATTASSAADREDIHRVPEGSPAPAPTFEPLPPPPPPPTWRVVAPEEPAEVQASLRRMPTRDPGLIADAGPTPRVPLEGNTDPARVSTQRAELAAASAAAETQGRRDAVQPMGEDAIYPTVPQETLQARVHRTSSGAASGNGSSVGGISGGGAAADDAISIIAQEQSGDEINAAMSHAQTEMVAQREKHAETAAEERTASELEIAQLQTENAREQASERMNARRDVAAQREQWSQQQQRLSDSAREDADDAIAETQADILESRESAELEAESHIDTGNEQAAEAREQGEQEAEQQRVRGEQEAESGGVFGWIKSRAKAFFERVKRGIQAAFERARAAVRAAIDRAKQLALAVIERARQAIVALIRRAGDLLIAIGDRLLAGYPALRERFRSAIQERVATAEAAVNRLADRLRDGVTAALDALGAALDAALGLLERGLLAAIDVANRVVQAAISAAQAVADALGRFVALIGDVAAGPGRWISNLGASIVDGIRNHLWRAFKEEVRSWFDSKLEQVLGLGTAIWEVLKRGGISIAQVGRMAFEALKAAIPMALIQLLIEKLVSMIVPAAGAVLAIVEGLRAAWGTVSRIITAFGRFFTFLRAVKPGNAGPQFAAALAAAAVVVIDFVANWLLRRLIRPARAVGGRIRAIAQRIMARLRRVAQRVGRAARRAGRRLRARIRRATRRRHGGRRTNERRGQDRDRRNRERLDRAVAAIRPRLRPMLARGVSRRMLNLRLAGWRVRYRLSRLSVVGNRVVARINPDADLDQIKKIPPQTLGRALQAQLRMVEAEFFRRQELQRPAAHQRRIAEAERSTSLGGTDPLGLSTAEQVEHFRRIQSGQIPLPSPIPIATPRPGGRQFRSPMVRPGEPGFSTYANRDPLGRLLLSGFYTIGAGSYPLAPSVLKAPSRRGLVQVLEPARGSGLFAASQVAEGLVERGALTPSEAYSGTHAPLAVAGGARASEIDEGLRAPSADPRTRAEDAAARRHRVNALREIFITLARSLDNPPVDVIAGSSEQAALQELARAFLDWARAQFTRIVHDESDARATAQAFRAKLLLYLQSMNTR